MRYRILLIALFFLAGALISGCDRQEAKGPHHFSEELGFSGIDVSAAGMTLPEFILPNVRDNREIKSSSYAGRILLVAFVSTWCPKCREEMSELQKIQGELPDSDFAVLGMVPEEDDQGEMKVIMDKMNLTYPMVVADEVVKKAFGSITDVPVAFLIDRQGLIRMKYLNHLDLPQLHKDIEELINRKQPS